MSVLVFLRHGQASFGAERYDQLSGTGREQARCVGRRLAEQQPGEAFALWSGPRNRHLETALLLQSTAGHSGAVQSLAALDEFAEGEEILAAASLLFGRPMDGAAAPERREQLRCYSEAYAAWANGRLDIPGRASFGAFRQGVGEWLREVVSETPAGRRIVAVTSAGVIAAAVCETLGLPEAHWLGMTSQMRNTGITEIVFSRGRSSLRSFNCAGHLPAGLGSSI